MAEVRGERLRNMLRRGCYNEEVPYPHFRLVLLDGSHKEAHRAEALALAREAGADLQLVKGAFGGEGDMAVCRLVSKEERGRVALERKHTERKNLFKQKAMDRMKTVRFGARTDANSMATKAKQLLSILKSGTRVRAAVLFKAEAEKRTGRVLGPKMLGRLLDPLIDEGHGHVVGEYHTHGNAMMSVIVEPSAAYKTAKLKRLDAWKDRRKNRGGAKGGDKADVDDEGMEDDEFEDDELLEDDGEDNDARFELDCGGGDAADAEAEAEAEAEAAEPSHEDVLAAVMRR